MCSFDKELQDADTWLRESQTVVEEVISNCRTFEYQKLKIDSGGSESNNRTQRIETNRSSARIGFQNSKKSGSKIRKGTSSSSRARERVVARDVDLAKLRVEQVD